MFFSRGKVCPDDIVTISYCGKLPVWAVYMSADIIRKQINVFMEETMRRTKQFNVIFTLTAMVFAFCTATARADEAGDLLKRGDSYYQNRDYDKAIADYTTALRIKPNYVEALFNRGRAYYEKYFSAESKNKSIDREMDLVLDRAITDFTDTLKIKPDHYEVLLWRGWAYYEKYDLDKAKADCETVLKSDPNNTNAKEMLELFQVLPGHLKNDKAEDYILRGYYFAIRNFYDKAIAEFTAALKIKPDLVNALYNRGLAYAKKGDYDKAGTDCYAILEINPNHADAKSLFGIIVVLRLRPKADAKKVLLETLSNLKFREI